MPNDNFEWTDADWEGIVAQVKYSTPDKFAAKWLLSQMNILMKSKESKIKEKERPTHVCPHCGLGLILPNNDQPIEEQPCMFDAEKLNKRKQELEEQKTNRDWEIVAWDNSGVTNDELIEGMIKRGYKIKSVKRLSDGEVFTVGEYIVFNGRNNPSEIRGFEISKFNGDMLVLYDNGGVRIKKVVKSKLPSVDDFGTKFFVSGREYVPKGSENQPLTGELITLEECERREKIAWDFAREKFSIDSNPFNKQYRFISFEQYKQHLKFNKEAQERYLKYKQSTK